MLTKLMERDFIFLDGSMGAMLQKRGLRSGEWPYAMSITAPEVVESVQREYCAAGSDIIYTNTFALNAEDIAARGYTAEELIAAAVGITKRACAGQALTALDIGPAGGMMEPVGKLTHGHAYEWFKRQAIAGEAAGADLAVIETMSDLNETEIAIAAVRENTKLPVFVTMTFGQKGYTLTGCTPEQFGRMAEERGAFAAGINCSLAPDEIFATAKRLAESTSLPLIIKPNAGLPDGLTGEYSIGPEEFARQMSMYTELGVKIVGGCCGTSPEYIKELRRVLSADREKSLPEN